MSDDFFVPRPNIEGENPNGYRVGDWLDVNCTSPRSYPPAILKWYINNEMVRTSWPDFYRKD